MTIAGGEFNLIQSNAYWAVIGGGANNLITGFAATVPGGVDNVASGQFSFAAGRKAKATNDGAFVWADSHAPDKRHIGPVAQDFHAAFGLGTHETAIATVDADGVALAAIQGLNEKVEAEVRGQKSGPGSWRRSLNRRKRRSRS